MSGVNLVTRLRAYDSKNHRGKYAVLCREAAHEIERLQTVLRRVKGLCGMELETADDRAVLREIEALVDEVAQQPGGE